MKELPKTGQLDAPILMEIEHTINWKYKFGYHIFEATSYDKSTYAVKEVTKDVHVKRVQTWYAYYKQVKYQHPIKYYRAKQLWLKYRNH